MTLILGGVTRGYAFHASDRLITRTRQKNETEAWDLASNKTVIVTGADCWLVIGYTGLAYLDDIPTDQFIAQAIAGTTNMVGMGGWHQPPEQLHYRAITSRIEHAMAAAYNRLPVAARRYQTTLLGVGLQARSSPQGPRHVMFESTIDGAGAQHLELADRWMGLGSFKFHGVGSIDPVLHEACRQVLKQEGDESPEHFRGALISAVQATGESSEVVGEDAMVVTLIPAAGRVEAFFTRAPGSDSVSLPPAAQATLGPSHERAVDTRAVYTPYFLAPGMYFSPSIATPGGGWTVGSGNGQLTFAVDGPGLISPQGFGFYGSHDRKPSR
ncbi:hypothetical protein SEA_RUTHY_33 [Gordonia phage Ruthy]|uniref:Uncharacterized protein n=1 Tax=Gordonia phage Ruthy TaxID=2250323 RepID=A0A345L5E4_9CAUD|nr:hypothetical protein HOT73_gp33 [Gordonia phage Ruthy]AXH50496.1 hypothetical protein SEA_RUTHY_33 [Gordonia phage Ruthy]